MDKKFELDDALNETIDRLIDAGMKEPDCPTFLGLPA